MSKHAYTCRFTVEEDAALKKRMAALGYKKHAAFLQDAALGRLGRDSADGVPGWCHDVTMLLNHALRDQETGDMRKDLLDVARRIDAGIRILLDTHAAMGSPR